MLVCFRFLVLLTIIGFYQVSLGQEIDKHRWQDRLLLVYSSDKNAKQFTEQIKLLEEKKLGFKERKLKVYLFTKKEYAYGLQKNWIKSNKLFKRFVHSDHHFKVLLIGLDGSIKLAQHKVLKNERLFNTIDAMPMRKSELRIKNE